VSFKPIKADDVTDLALLPAQFRRFASEMKEDHRLFTLRFATISDKISRMLLDYEDRFKAIERRLTALEKRAERRGKR